MKTLIAIAFMLLATLQSNGQTGKMIFGIGFNNVPQITKLSDGRWEVRGDSMTAIKMLWREIERRDSANESYKRQLFKVISQQQKQINLCAEYRNQIVNLMKSLKR